MLPTHMHAIQEQAKETERHAADGRHSVLHTVMHDGGALLVCYTTTMNDCPFDLPTGHSPPLVEH